MANLQIRNLPEPLLARLRYYAQQQHRTLNDIVLSAIEHEMTRCEWFERLAQRPSVDLGVSASSLLEEERWQWELG
jgi:plasmid stability protein